MSSTPVPFTQPNAHSTLRGRLTATRITVMVVAAAAPLGAVVGTVPLAFALGSGVAMPFAFIAAGLVLLLFSTGYAAMSRRITGAGGFYSYVTQGFGRIPGVTVAFVAVVAYNAMAIALAGGMGYFGTLIVDLYTGWRIPWPVAALIGVVVAGTVGYRGVDIASRVLLALVALEIVVLLVLDVGVIVQRGLAAFPLGAISPVSFFATGVPVIGLMFALQTFVGFESAALYGEEAQQPRKTIPRAIYSSVIVIAVFYAFSTWVAVGAIGTDDVAARAQAELGDLFFGLSAEYVSPVLSSVMLILMLTTTLAGQMALHNAASRYMFALGRDRLLPEWIGVVHPRYGTPSRASIIQTILAVLVVFGFYLAGMDPYTNLLASLLGLGTIGILVLQAAAAAAIVAFFLRQPSRNIWTTIVAPSIAGFVFVGVVVLTLLNFPLITGTDSGIVNGLPLLLIAAAVYGLLLALWLRARKPARYALLAEPPDGAEPGLDIPRPLDEHVPTPSSTTSPKAES